MKMQPIKSKPVMLLFVKLALLLPILACLAIWGAISKIPLVSYVQLLCHTADSAITQPSV
jgi:hypothetical protein